MTFSQIIPMPIIMDSSGWENVTGNELLALYIAINLFILVGYSILGIKYYFKNPEYGSWSGWREYLANDSVGGLVCGMAFLMVNGIALLLFITELILKAIEA